MSKWYEHLEEQEAQVQAQVQAAAEAAAEAEATAVVDDVAEGSLSQLYLEGGFAEMGFDDLAVQSESSDDDAGSVEDSAGSSQASSDADGSPGDLAVEPHSSSKSGTATPDPAEADSAEADVAEADTAGASPAEAEADIAGASPAEADIAGASPAEAASAYLQPTMPSIAAAQVEQDVASTSGIAAASMPALPAAVQGLRFGLTSRILTEVRQDSHFGMSGAPEAILGRRKSVHTSKLAQPAQLGPKHDFGL